MSMVWRLSFNNPLLGLAKVRWGGDITRLAMSLVNKSTWLSDWTYMVFYILAIQPKGKPNDPASASTSARLHPRCRCRCRTLAQSPWHKSNMDKFFCRRCRTPYITSSYVGRLLSIVTDDPAEFEK